MAAKLTKVIATRRQVGSRIRPSQWEAIPATASLQPFYLQALRCLRLVTWFTEFRGVPASCTAFYCCVRWSTAPCNTRLVVSYSLSRDDIEDRCRSRLQR